MVQRSPRLRKNSRTRGLSARRRSSSFTAGLLMLNVPSNQVPIRSIAAMTIMRSSAIWSRPVRTALLWRSRFLRATSVRTSSDCWRKTVSARIRISRVLRQPMNSTMPSCRRFPMEVKTALKAISSRIPTSSIWEMTRRTSSTGSCATLTTSLPVISMMRWTR